MRFRSPAYEDSRLRLQIREAIDMVRAETASEFLKIAKKHNATAQKDMKNPNVRPNMKKIGAEDMALLKEMASSNFERIRRSKVLEFLGQSSSLSAPTIGV